MSAYTTLCWTREKTLAYIQDKIFHCDDKTLEEVAEIFLRDALYNLNISSVPWED